MNILDGMYMLALVVCVEYLNCTFKLCTRSYVLALVVWRILWMV